MTRKLALIGLSLLAAQLAYAEFHYFKGQCKNQEGQEGMNPVNLEALFKDGLKVSTAQVKGYQFKNQNAECGDFRNVHFGKVRPDLLGMFQLTDWNLAGANFKGANLSRLRIDGEESNLRGVDFRPIILSGSMMMWGYVDEFWAKGKGSCFGMAEKGGTFRICSLDPTI